MSVGICAGCKAPWCDRENHCSRMCHGNCKTIQNMKKESPYEYQRWKKNE